jgi:hypothetical protein
MRQKIVDNLSFSYPKQILLVFYYLFLDKLLKIKFKPNKRSAGLPDWAGVMVA